MTRTRGSASLFFASGGLFSLRCPYSVDLVAALKREVAKWARSYDPETKVWTFDRSQLGLVKALCVRHLGEVYVDPALEPSRQPSADARLELLGRLIAPLSETGLRQVYRIVMLELHPDRGGDAHAAQEANVIWGRMKSRGRSAA